jgi:hypothetical protein
MLHVRVYLPLYLSYTECVTTATFFPQVGYVARCLCQIQAGFMAFVSLCVMEIQKIFALLQRRSLFLLKEARSGTSLLLFVNVHQCDIRKADNPPDNLQDCLSVVGFVHKTTASDILVVSWYCRSIPCC